MNEPNPTPILSRLRPAPGSRPRRTRLGTGEGSGTGQTATRGQKGQRSRSGDGKQVGFEGGQTPLLRRIPKRGFSNGAFRREMQIVHLSDLGRVFKNQQEVTLEALKLHGLTKGVRPVKVLSDGELAKPLKIQAHAFSKKALEKIQKAGGAAEVVGAKAGK
ncbi:MAG: 50S ribosomal protein L15 [Elusimicrobia bacterium]|nr:50S ribosomal protein L15 [Elusimicrobiota bacterium]